MSPETFDYESAKLNSQATVNALLGKLTEDSDDYEKIDELSVFLENDEVGEKALSIRMMGEALRLSRADDASTAFDKINAFLAAVSTKVGAKTASTEAIVAEEADEVSGEAASVTEPLVPGNPQTFWRDVNAEVELLANVFKGTGTEKALRGLRKASHNRTLGKEDLNIVIGKDSLQIWSDDPEESILMKIAVFVEGVKRHNKEMFAPKVHTPKEAKDNDIDPLYWRDVIAGIDSLVDAYPDTDYSTLEALRDMLQKGELGGDDRLLLNIGSVFLNILKRDNEDVMLEKIAVFIGELKQIAGTTDKGTEAPLDAKLDQTYWRDIDAALEELEPLHGKNPQFKLLRISIKKGILGTVRNFKATIDGVTLDIRQSDTDGVLRDKLSKFIRELSEGGVVKINEKIRQEHAELEQKYHEMEAASQDLESRYRDAQSDMHQRDSQIRRLETSNSQYEDEIRRLQRELSAARANAAPAPSRSTSRSYGG